MEAAQKQILDLHYKIFAEEIDQVEKLISEGVDVNTPDDTGATPLHIACGIGSYEIVEILINNGADVKATNARRDTPLHLACVNGDWNIVEILCGFDADPLAKNVAQETPLEMALEALDEISTFIILKTTPNALESYPESLFLKHVMDKKEKIRDIWRKQKKAGKSQKNETFLDYMRVFDAKGAEESAKEVQENKELLKENKIYNSGKGFLKMLGQRNDPIPESKVAGGKSSKEEGEQTFSGDQEDDGNVVVGGQSDENQDGNQKVKGLAENEDQSKQNIDGANADGDANTKVGGSKDDSVIGEQRFGSEPKEDEDKSKQTFGGSTETKDASKQVFGGGSEVKDDSQQVFESGPQNKGESTNVPSYESEKVSKGTSDIDPAATNKKEAPTYESEKKEKTLVEHSGSNQTDKEEGYTFDSEGKKVKKDDDLQEVPSSKQKETEAPQQELSDEDKQALDAIKDQLSQSKKILDDRLSEEKAAAKDLERGEEEVGHVKWDTGDEIIEYSKKKKEEKEEEEEPTGKAPPIEDEEEETEDSDEKQSLKKMDLTKKNKHGETPLMVAARKGFVDVVEDLIHKGAQVNIRDYTGTTCLMRTLELGHNGVVKVLLKHNAKHNFRTPKGDSTLSFAVLNNNPEGVQLLADAGANLNARIKSSTPLMVAAAKGFTETVEVLLSAGADCKIKDIKGRTAADYAKIRGHLELHQKLEAQTTSSKRNAKKGWRS